MKAGILNESTCRELYEKINGRLKCDKCRDDRKEYKSKDQKYNSCYSSLGLGFSSDSVKLPLDVLIVAESHGGGHPEGFRKQLDVDKEILGMKKYYTKESIVKFHQYQMRSLLNKLDEKGLSWVFTDLVKCYVEKEQKNFSIAVEQCKSYLDDQINLLKPKVIIGLGNIVSRSYFKVEDTHHGKKYNIFINDIAEDHSYTYIHSIFPSRNTADTWVKNNQWDGIIHLLDEVVQL